MHTELAVDPAADPIRTMIWEEVAIDTTRTWEAQKQAFKKWHQISPDWLQLEGLAEVRNAVAHGLGTLTRRQQRSHSSTMTKINRTGISIVNDEVVLEEQDLVSAARACRDLIHELDAAVTAKTP
ncbi:hypothetical protein [Terrabacter lapilli]